MAKVQDHAKGVPVPPQVDEDWFDAEVGVGFYRGVETGLGGASGNPTLTGIFSSTLSIRTGLRTSVMGASLRHRPGRWFLRRLECCRSSESRLRLW